MKKILAISKIIENRQIACNYYLMKFENKNKDIPLPGQFINLKIRNSLDPLIRRPFAVFDFNSKAISILYKVIGKSTTILSHLHKNDEIEYFGFLGTPFEYAPVNKKTWIIAGGIGIGGIHLFLKKIKLKNNVELFMGFNTKEEASDFKSFLKHLNIKVNISVLENYKNFFHGNVIQLIKKNSNSPDFLFACGPEEMLKSLYQNIIQKKNIPAFFSMESIMACGIGSCMGCAIKIREKKTIKLKRVCKDGPVFEANKIIWE